MPGVDCSQRGTDVLPSNPTLCEQRVDGYPWDKGDFWMFGRRADLSPDDPRPKDEVYR